MVQPLSSDSCELWEVVVFLGIGVAHGAAKRRVVPFCDLVSKDAALEDITLYLSRDLIGRLHGRQLIATGPRSPQPGAPYTYVTTEQFLLAFGLESLRDLPDRQQMEDAGVIRAVRT